MRGIHGDVKTYKLVTCVYGEVHQVVVDCRKDSQTYLKWEKFIINENNQQIILIPPNMGNSYYVSSNHAVYYYKLAYDGEYLDAQDQFTYAWNDEKIGINWPTTKPILSGGTLLQIVAIDRITHSFVSKCIAKIPYYYYYARILGQSALCKKCHVILKPKTILLFFKQIAQLLLYLILT